eukprot:SAG31_NODE_6220_length_2114_cov_1.084367_2_plen_216_part_00
MRHVRQLSLAHFELRACVSLHASLLLGAALPALLDELWGNSCHDSFRGFERSLCPPSKTHAHPRRSQTRTSCRTASRPAPSRIQNRDTRSIRNHRGVGVPVLQFGASRTSVSVKPSARHSSTLGAAAAPAGRSASARASSPPRVAISGRRSSSAERRGGGAALYGCTRCAGRLPLPQPQQLRLQVSRYSCLRTYSCLHSCSAARRAAARAGGHRG